MISSSTLLGELHYYFEFVNVGDLYQVVMHAHTKSLVHNLCNCVMSTWMMYRFIYTQSYIYIHRYSDFLVGLALACPKNVHLFISLVFMYMRKLSDKMSSLGKVYYSSGNLLS